MPRRRVTRRSALLAGLTPLLIAPAVHAEPPGRPAPEARLAGEPGAPAPLGLTARVRAHASLLGASSFPTDTDGTEYTLDPTLDTQVRVRADYRHAWGKDDRFILTLAYEHDLMSGVVAGGPAPFEAIDAPYSADAEETALRVASARLSLGNVLTLAAGAMTSHWGLGLLANDGAHGWAPGSARFSDPRGGDRVLRAMLATGPHTDHSLLVFTAIDSVIADDVLIGGDTAWQAVFGALLGTPSSPWQAGLYGVYRVQEASDGDRTEIGVLDFYGKLEDVGPELTLRAELEAALVFGTTDLAPTPDHPRHDVLQSGLALRLSLEACLGGAALDVLLASGDPAWDDDTQSGFKADRNFDMGLLLNDVVLAARTARTPIRASNPDLVAVPAEDLDRLPTRGAATNTVSLFPRGWLRPIDGLELYGGVLIALSASDETDAFNARLGGGTPKNALGGGPATLVATEVDVGVRASGLLFGTRLTLGLEGGVLLPGAGLTGPDGLGEDPIWGGRLLATYEL